MEVVMVNIGFVTDSTAYLTKEQIQQSGVRVIPLSVIFGGKSYREGIDISNEDFYARLPQLKELPTTSQPPVGEMVSLFKEMLESYDSIMCLFLSDKLSGTYQTAKAAAEMVDAKRIAVVDSRISSYGIAGPLLDGVEMARNGGTVEQILEMWEKELESEEAYFIVDTLEFLHKGGRIGGAAAAFGSLLQIKPILTMVEGRIDLFEKIRTHRRAVDRAKQMFAQDAASGMPLNLGVVHSVRLEDAKALRDELTAKYPHVNAGISELGPVVGTHTGPGLLALVYYQRQNLQP